VQDADGLAVAFANVALYTQESKLVKVETTDDAGLFRMDGIADGTYDIVVTYLGAPDLRKEDIEIKNGVLDLGVLQLAPAAVELAEATVTATRALVEIKPDRTVFNVQGTINAVGQNGLDLLRKAPGVTIDNNDNINVLSRSGVLVYALRPSRSTASTSSPTPVPSTKPRATPASSTSAWRKRKMKGPTVPPT